MSVYEKIRGLLTEAKGGGKGFQPRKRTKGGQAAHGVTLGRDEQFLRSNVERLAAMAKRAGRDPSPALKAMLDRLAKNPNPDDEAKRLGEAKKKESAKDRDDARLAKDKRDLDIIHSKKKFEVGDLVPQFLRPKINKGTGGRYSSSREYHPLSGRQKEKTKGERLHGRKVRRAERRLKARDDAADSARIQKANPRKKPLETRMAISKVKHKRDVAIAKKKADKEVLKASTEINMQGYGRLAEMLGGQAKPSHGFPGHEKRMKGHMERIQKDPRFTEPDQATRDKGKKGASASNKAQAKKKEKG
tara:strand:+ start:1305 stop:2213 length:909 start_codon:yes stop_codon:yes gene_type:complete